MAKKPKGSTDRPNIGLNVINTGSGIGFHSEASGFATTGIKVVVGQQSKGFLSSILSLGMKILGWFKT